MTQNAPQRRIPDDEPAPKASREDEERYGDNVEIIEPPIEPPNNRNYPPRRYGGTNRSSNSGGLSSYIMPAIISVIIFAMLTILMQNMMGGGGYILKKDFTTNLGNISNDISSIYKSIDGITGKDGTLTMMQKSVETAQATANDASTTAAKAQTAADKTASDLAKIKVPDVSGFITSSQMNSTISSAVSSAISGIKPPDLTPYAKSADLTGLSKQTDVDAAVKKLQDQIDALKTATPTTPANTQVTITSTPNPVTISTAPNVVNSTFSVRITNSTATAQTSGFFVIFTNNSTAVDIFDGATIKSTLTGTIGANQVTFSTSYSPSGSATTTIMFVSNQRFILNPGQYIDIVCSVANTGTVTSETWTGRASLN